MKYYNPESNNIHQVKIDLMFEGFSGALIYEASGNASGSTILWAAIDSLANGDFIAIDHDLNRKHVKEMDESGYAEVIALYKGNEELLFEIEDIEDCVIGVKIVGYREKN